MSSLMRVVNLDSVGMALDNYTEAEYSVAMERGESLWEVKIGIDSRIDFLYAIGLLTEKERDAMLELSEKTYKEKSGAKEVEKICDVGF